jgi:hypothetical protein
MNTDKSVQNQKVFVTLAAVLQLQTHYQQIVAYQGAAIGDCENDCRAAEREVVEQVIRTLGLPIEINNAVPRTYAVVQREVSRDKH